MQAYANHDQVSVLMYCSAKLTFLNGFNCVIHCIIEKLLHHSIFV